MKIHNHPLIPIWDINLTSLGEVYVAFRAPSGLRTELILLLPVGSTA